MSTYDELRRVIPPDQALACKAVESALLQIKNIFDSTLPLFATATTGLETNKGLALINALTSPLPADVIAYYANTYATGTGLGGTILLADLIGTAAGWVHNTQLPISTSTLSSLANSGALVTLTNNIDGVFTIMQNTIDGDYTVIIDPGPPEIVEITIPPGLPGEGVYSSYDDAFEVGLIPAAYELIADIVAANPSLVAQANSSFQLMCAQLVNEASKLAKVPIVFADITPNIPPTPLVNNLQSYGQDTAEGGSAYILESVSDISTRGGQAIVSTMREGRNLVRLTAAGLDSDIIVSDEGVEIPATLSDGDYTVDQAISRIVY